MRSCPSTIHGISGIPVSEPVAPGRDHHFKLYPFAGNTLLGDGDTGNSQDLPRKEEPKAGMLAKSPTEEFLLVFR